MAGDEEQLVGRSYTRARKHPLVIGKLPGAGRLPGGPYTITQVVTMTGTFVLLVLTRELWAHFGLVDVVVLVVLPWGLAWVLRYARLDGRDPARALRSLAGYAAAPVGGRFAGEPLRTRRPASLIGACTVRFLPDPPTTAGRPPSGTEPGTADRRAAPGSTVQRPAAGTRARQIRPAAGAPDAQAPARTALQDLLAALDRN